MSRISDVRVEREESLIWSKNGVQIYRHRDPILREGCRRKEIRGGLMLI